MFDTSYTYLPRRPAALSFRTIIIPGMDGTADNFMRTVTTKRWAEGLVAVGSDVIILNTPIPKPCWFKNGGADYRALFLAELKGIIADVSAHHGSKRTIVAGSSYGGLHAMVSYTSIPGFIGWQAALPVTHLSVLTEMADVGKLPAFDAFAEAPKLRNTSGFVSWADADMRVDHRLDKALYREIESPDLKFAEYPATAHKLTDAAVADLVADAQRQVLRAQ